jgi:galactose-6-phosphate isomerase
VPLLDVSEITLDVDFSDVFDVVRRNERVNGNGISVPTLTTYRNQVGVVYLRGKNDLKRSDDNDLTEKEVYIVTKFRLQGTSPGVKPDTVLWHGSRFIVSRVEDFSNFGAGFIRARCTSMGLQDPPPQS